ncbi:anaerobic glycerol-3-phosphate dehydrogenase subunit GlpB [uncultured Muribaculum sp.]|uniref:anaerobic glycerol-3-phosphate dehydrogenase subunit GlpB n=1 Tax=uncultured Muribaculum sp. TaxID=1918613 RepID=UPI002635EE69|nr:anaerobic glycerol-3-phosphate dehydrogenase subunit GlpB [uncultured Muribaculum sp.]
MKYDTIIIGGSEAAFASGLILADAGQKVGVISHGQTFLHCSAASLGLLGYDKDGNPVQNPVEAMAALPDSHPYSKIGVERVCELAQGVKELFVRSGIPMHGSYERNHYRMSPIGVFKPAWLSMDTSPVAASPDDVKTWGKVLILGIEGFLDFFAKFIASGLGAIGVNTEIRNISLPELSALRSGSTEKMRATNIARVIVSEKNIEDVALRINIAVESSHADTVVMPAVFGLSDPLFGVRLQSKLKCRLMFVPTMPVSVPGLCAKGRFESRFREIGGTLFYGDTVSGGEFVDGCLKSVRTLNMAETALYADNFILATGNFINHGLVASPSGVSEPLFGLDIMPFAESGFTGSDFFSRQPYMKCGVATDSDFRVALNGNMINNFYAAGSILGGCDTLKEESGAGVEYISAIAVAKKILEKKGGLK